MPRRDIKDVLKRYTDELMGISGVVGVAEGESMGKPCIKVFVMDIYSESIKSIPGKLDGYPLHIVKSGGFQALSRK